MAMKDPRKAAEKWARNLSQSTESIKEGVRNVTESPTAKAARAADRYATGVQAAVASGKFQAGCNRVSLPDWQKAMLDKGVNRIGSGAAAATPKMEQFNAEFYPHLEAGQRMLQSMPRGGLDANIQRMVANAQHNANFRRRS